MAYRHFFQQAQTRWRGLIEPPDSITDPMERHFARLLNSLLLIFSPFAFVLTLFGNLFDTTPQYIYTDKVFWIATFSSAFLLFIYILSQKGYYRLGMWLILIIGTMIIVIFARSSGVPFDQLNFLILMPLLVSIFFPFRTSMVLYVVYLGVGYFFKQFIFNQPIENVYDFMLFFGTVEVFIIFTSYQRNLLEKDRQQKFIESEARLCLLLGQLPCVTWSLDARLQVDSVNGNPKVINEREQVLFKNQLAYEVKQHRFDEVLHGQSLNYETVWWGVPYQHQVEPLRANDGKIIGCIGISLDLTEHKQQEQKKLEFVTQQERARMQVEFMRNVTHDLKTPITTINTSLHILRRLEEPQQREERITRIERQVNYLNQMFDGMLRLSRLDLLPLENLMPVNVNSLIQSLKHDRLSRIEKHGIDIKLDLNDDLPYVDGHETELYEALDHILTNALQHSASGDLISIRTRCSGHATLLIEVEDQGPGIPESDLPHVFERFYRVEKHRPHDEMHIGLGLSIAKTIIERHKGTIAIKSKVDEGTTVTLHLPC